MLNEAVSSPFDLLKRIQRGGRVALSKDDTLAFVTHELRLPVSAIMGWASILKMNRSDDQLFARAIAAIERNTQMQEYLIAELSEVTSLEQGNIRLQLCTLEIVETISDVIETMLPLARAKEIRINTEFQPTSCTVRGDKMRLQQVFANLLNNALKFTEPGGHIAVKVNGLASEVEISISDTGCGIGRESLPLIFEQYWQEERGQSHKVRGSLGLGLSIVRQLVELHGGSVRADSQGHGFGATFFVWLPQLDLKTTGGPGNTQPLNEEQEASTVCSRVDAGGIREDR